MDMTGRKIRRTSPHTLARLWLAPGSSSRRSWASAIGRCAAGLLAAAVMLAAASANAAECEDEAAAHPDWVFCHDFEAADADTWDNYWDSSAPPDPDRLFLVDDNPPSIAGSHMMRVQLVNPTDQDMDSSLGAGLGKWFGETVTWDAFYYRKYMRFNEEFHQGNFMHLGRLRACAPSIYPWECLGGSGQRPAGDTKYTTGLEPWSDYQSLDWPGRWGFYSYYHLMSQDCGFPGPDDCYGDMFAPAQDAMLSRAEWHVVEFMIQPNTPGQQDGYQRFWIDGVSAYTSDPIDWRTVDSLRINQASIGVYIHNPPAQSTNIVDYDNVIFSTSYVGATRCLDNVQLAAPCMCGGEADPEDGSNVHSSGYCCNEQWQAESCGGGSGGGGAGAGGTAGGGVGGGTGGTGNAPDPAPGLGEDSEGCGCQLPGAGRSGGAAALLLLVLGVRRRR